MKSFQVFPRKQSALEWCNKNNKSDLKIDKNTKIISIGSCFAREIKYWLINNKFNYIVGETDKNPWVSNEIFTGDEGRLPSDHGSIAWERVYNLYTLHHLLRSSIYKSYSDDRFHSFNFKGTEYVADLFRNRIVYPDLRTAKIDVLDHSKNTLDIIKEADLIIITMGTTEIWSNGRITLGSYSTEYKVDDSFKFRTTYFSNNITSLLLSYGLLKLINPKIKILLSVSPVHLKVSFREDINVVSASCQSKSILRAVAGEVCEFREDIYYFPSYEIATMLSPLDGIDTYREDKHHVSNKVIDEIMNVFVSTFT